MQAIAHRRVNLVEPHDRCPSPSSLSLRDKNCLLEPNFSLSMTNTRSSAEREEKEKTGMAVPHLST